VGGTRAVTDGVFRPVIRWVSIRPTSRWKQPECDCVDVRSGSRAQPDEAAWVMFTISRPAQAGSPVIAVETPLLVGRTQLFVACGKDVGCGAVQRPDISEASIRYNLRFENEEKFVRV